VIRVARGWDEVEGEIAPKSKQGRRKVPIPSVLRVRLEAWLLDAPDSGRIFHNVRASYDKATAAPVRRNQWSSTGQRYLRRRGRRIDRL
jgi:hypothetical protein